MPRFATRGSINAWKLGQLRSIGVPKAVGQPLHEVPGSQLFVCSSVDSTVVCRPMQEGDADTARLLSSSGKRKLCRVPVVVAVAVSAVLVLVLVGGLLGGLLGRDEQLPSPFATLAWVDCTAWLNGSLDGFPLSTTFFSGGCAQLTYCARPGGGVGYRPQNGQQCLSPGPTMRFAPGRTYGLILCADPGTEATNLHTHGLHVSGEGNSDDMMRFVLPGDCIFYQYKIPDYHMVSVPCFCFS